MNFPTSCLNYSHCFVQKIADFGLATIMDPDKRHMTMCGTPNYISPEVSLELIIRIIFKYKI